MTEALGSTGRPCATEHPRRTPGTPCWASLLVHDLAAAEEFYGALFGWEFRPQPATALPGRSVLALLDGIEVAGIGRRPPSRRFPVSWTSYLASDDVDATAELVRHRGGTIGVGPLDVPTVGRLAVASDPSGAVFGILQAAATGDRGIHRGIHSVPGTPAWAELITYEAQVTAKFYQDVFGHVAQPDRSAGPDQLTLHLTDGPVASVRSMGSKPRDQGARWTTRFGTTDVDALVRRATGLGGTVIEPPHNGLCGRVATLADPEGAVFTLDGRHDEPGGRPRTGPGARRHPLPG
jgi:predicted enzyme related to lactoylglutathione lyase